MEETKKKLRFGIMIDGNALELWQIESIKQLTNHGVELALIIRNNEPAEKKGLFKRLRAYPFRKLFFRVWHHYFFRPECKRRADLNEFLNIESIPKLGCIPDRQGFATVITNNDIETILSYRLDFILRFGFNILSGSILNAAKHGVWSFHHDDEMSYRGAPPGFWEFMRNDPINGIILQRLTESLDCGIILKKVFYPTILHSYKAHLNQLYFEGESLPLQVCLELERTGNIAAYKSVSKAKIYQAPKNAEMLRYWMLCLTRRIRFHLHDIFRQEDWNVGYLEASVTDFINDPEAYKKEIKWFRRRSAHSYYADPFVIKTERDTYIFFEHYDYKTGKGRIGIALQSEKFRKHHTALVEPFHLSYPFVFRKDGIIYCLPEANESNRLTLYRFCEEQMRLIKDCVLLENIRAVDPTLCFENGKWNLFLTQKDFASVKLYRYLADNLRGPYEPFYGNPIKTDCRNARMAGAFIRLNGKLLRPAQESIRYYGTAVCINNVTELSEDYYDEEQSYRIAPMTETKFNKGIHTLNGNSEMTVLDGKRFAFSFFGMFHQIAQKRKKTS